MQRIVLLLGLALLLSSCASTTGYREDKTVKSDLDFRNNRGIIIQYFPVDAVTSDESKVSSLGTTQDIAPKAETSLSRASQAGQAVSKLGEGLQLIEDMQTFLKENPPVTPATSVVTPADPPPQEISNIPRSKVPVEVPAEDESTPPWNTVEPILETSGDVFEEAEWYGVNKDNGRTIWYWKQQMDQYPKNFNVTMEGCGTIEVRDNKGVRIDFDENYKLTTKNTSRDKVFISPTRFDPIKRPDKPQVMTLVGTQSCKTKRAYMTLPVPTKPTVSIDTSMYSNKEVIPLKPVENGSKSFGWGDGPGHTYGKNLLVVYGNNCGWLQVPDGAQGHGEDGNFENHNQRFYFSGDPTQQPDTSPSGLKPGEFGLMSVFTYNCLADTATIHFN